MSQRESSSSAVIWASRHGTHRIRLADLGPQVPGEDLGVAGLVHRLRGRVVLGIDPRDRLDDLGRREHGALLAVHELAEAGREELDRDLRELAIRPRRDRRTGHAGRRSHQLHHRRVGGHECFRIDLGRPVQLGHAVPLRRVGLVVERDQLLALALVAPRVDGRSVIGDQRDRRSHLGRAGQFDGGHGRFPFVVDARRYPVPRSPGRRGGRARWPPSGRRPGSWRTRWRRGCGPSSG